MSFYVIDWATSVAPTANIYESHILTVMGSRADRDGCGVFLSIAKLAKACHCDPKTVSNHLKEMVKRGLLGPGDLTSPGAKKYARIRGDNRPNLYDILVPVSWYSAQMLADINEERDEAGRPLLTTENRPEIAAAPPKKRRSDLGKARPERRKPTVEEPTLEATGGVSVPPCEPSLEPERGESVSPREGDEIPVAGGMTFPQYCQGNLSGNPVIGGASRHPPEPPAARTAERDSSLGPFSGDQQGDQLTACAGVRADDSEQAGDNGSGSQIVVSAAPLTIPQPVTVRAFTIDTAPATDALVVTG